MHIHGSCHCENIRFEAEVDPGQTTICHCTDCQKLTGSAYRVSVPALAGTFRLVAGEPRIYVKTGDNGARRAQAFCPECGSRIYASAAVPEPERYNLRVGTIRQRRELRPRTQVWCRSALGWAMDLGSVEPQHPMQG